MPIDGKFSTCDGCHKTTWEQNNITWFGKFWVHDTYECKTKAIENKQQADEEYALHFILQDPIDKFLEEQREDRWQND